MGSWSTTEHETATGAVESRQWIGLARGFVTADEEGARQLGRRYLDEVLEPEGGKSAAGF